MRERVTVERVDLATIEALEATLQARLGWIDRAISPFAIAARNPPETDRTESETPPERPALPMLTARALRLAG